MENPKTTDPNASTAWSNVRALSLPASMSCSRSARYNLYSSWLSSAIIKLHVRFFQIPILSTSPTLTSSLRRS